MIKSLKTQICLAVHKYVLNCWANAIFLISVLNLNDPFNPYSNKKEVIVSRIKVFSPIIINTATKSLFVPDRTISINVPFTDNIFLADSYYYSCSTHIIIGLLRYNVNSLAI